MDVAAFLRFRPGLIELDSVELRGLLCGIGREGPLGGGSVIECRLADPANHESFLVIEDPRVLAVASDNCGPLGGGQYSFAEEATLFGRCRRDSDAVVIEHVERIALTRTYTLNIDLDQDGEAEA